MRKQFIIEMHLKQCENKAKQNNKIMINSIDDTSSERGYDL